MLTEDWISVAIIVICLVLSLFFSGSETALTGFSRARMLQLEKNGNARARVVNRLVETRERMIGAILAGNNVANIAASALTTGLLFAWFGEVGVLYATDFAEPREQQPSGESGGRDIGNVVAGEDRADHPFARLNQAIDHAGARVAVLFQLQHPRTRKAGERGLTAGKKQRQHQADHDDGNRNPVFGQHRSASFS